MYVCVCVWGGGGGAHREFIFELALRSSLWEAEEGESVKCTVSLECGSRRAGP